MDDLITTETDELNDLAPDVQAMVAAADTDLAQHGVDVEADMKATDGADELQDAPASDGITSTTKPQTEATVTSFGSRGKARTYANDNGLRVIDNGASAGTDRWTVGPKSDVASKSATRLTIGQARSRRSSHPGPAPTTVTKPGAKPADKKTVAMTVYSELEKKGTLKRSAFISEMSTRTGLSEKGASSYFYRIKGGKW